MIARYELYPLGERAVVIRWQGEVNAAMQQLVSETVTRLERQRLPAVLELVRTYRTVTVYYDPVRLYLEERSRRHGNITYVEGSNGGQGVAPFDTMCVWIHAGLQGMEASREDNGAWDEELPYQVTVPVCFGGRFGPDLEAVALRADLSVDAVITLYCSADYVVHMIGFVPGFPYLGGLPERLHTPRRSEPRMSVPAGSVGIAGQQTGIYPQAIPGGWQLIGQTPLRLFDAERTSPAYLRAGDRVSFKPISEAEFARLQQEEGLGWR